MLITEFVSVKQMFQHFGKYTYLCFGGELAEMIDATLVSVQLAA